MGAGFPILEAVPAVGGGAGENEREPGSGGEEKCRHGHRRSAYAAATPWTKSASASFKVMIMRHWRCRQCLDVAVVVHHHHLPSSSPSKKVSVYTLQVHTNSTYVSTDRN